MQFTAVLAALATFGVSAVSAAPFTGGHGIVMSWDFFVSRGVARINELYPGAKVVSIVGHSYNDTATSNIMSVQSFDITMDLDGKTVYTTNYDHTTWEPIPEFTEAKVTGGHMIGNTAFELNEQNVAVKGFEAQDAFRAQAGDAEYSSITLRNTQHPYGIWYFFNVVGQSSKPVLIKANAS